MFWHTRHLNLDVFLIRLFSASVAAGMCFVATALTLMDEDKQYRILSAELVVGAAHLFFKDWVARHQGTSFVVSLYSYSLVVGLALDQTRFHRFMLSMGFAALCWFGLAVARADLLVHEVVAVNRVLLALAFVGPFLTTRALGVAVAVAISAVFVVLLQRGMGNEDAEAAENAALIAKDMVDDVMSRLPIGIQAFRELEQFELDRIYREASAFAGAGAPRPQQMCRT